MTPEEMWDYLRPSLQKAPTDELLKHLKKMNTIHSKLTSMDMYSMFFGIEDCIWELEEEIKRRGSV